MPTTLCVGADTSGSSPLGSPQDRTERQISRRVNEVNGPHFSPFQLMRIIPKPRIATHGIHPGFVSVPSRGGVRCSVFHAVICAREGEWRVFCCNKAMCNPQPLPVAEDVREAVNGALSRPCVPSGVEASRGLGRSGRPARLDTGQRDLPSPLQNELRHALAHRVESRHY